MLVKIKLSDEIGTYLQDNPESGRKTIAEKFAVKDNVARVYASIAKMMQEVDKGTAENIEISELGHIKVDKELSPGKTGRVTVQGKDLSENFSEDGAINRAIKKAKIDKKNWDIFKISIGHWDVTLKPRIKTGPRPQDFEDQIYHVTHWKVNIQLKAKTPEIKSFETILKQLQENSINIPSIYKKTTSKNNSRRELEIDILDPHLGLCCFKNGSDLEQTIESMEQLILSVVENLLQQAKKYGPFERIIWPFGHDYLHADNVFNTTTAGTIQPEASSWHHVYIRGELLGIAVVNRLKQEAPVKMIVVPGNHDRHSAFTLGRLYAAWFHNDKNVEVICKPDPYKFHQFGVNLIGFEHGHSVNAVRLAALMANETRRDGWAEAKYCEWHLGDQHRKGSSKPSMLEEQGVSIEYLPGLTAPNEWHRLKSFNHQKRSGLAFIWDYNKGPIARLQINIDNQTGLIMGI